MKSQLVRVLTAASAASLVATLTAVAPVAAAAQPAGSPLPSTNTSTVDPLTPKTPVASAHSWAEVDRLQQQQKQQARLSKEQITTLENDGKYRYQVSSSNYDGSHPNAANDPVTFDQCVAQFTSGFKGDYWIKNHFAMCRYANLRIVYYSNNTVIGTTTFRSAVILNSRTDGQNIDVGFRLDYVSSTDPTLDAGAQLTLVPQCVVNSTDRQSACNFTPVQVGRPVNSWKTAGSNTATFSLTTSTSGAPANDPHQAEQRGDFGFNPQYVASGIGDGRIDVQNDKTEILRCDQASYVPGTARCIFNHVTPTISFDSTDTKISEAANFVRDAQTDITRTKPGIIGTYVPGSTASGKPLHRLYKAYDKNGWLNGARKKIRQECRHSWGSNYTKDPSGGPARSCDEYPFNVTYENAASVTPGQGGSAASYAVRALNKDHNSQLGSNFGTWLGQDRILDGDAFFVVVT